MEILLRYTLVDALFGRLSVANAVLASFDQALVKFDGELLRFMCRDAARYRGGERRVFDLFAGQIADKLLLEPEQVAPWVKSSQGLGAKFPGQQFSKLDKVLEDGDIVEIHVS